MYTASTAPVKGIHTAEKMDQMGEIIAHASRLRGSLVTEPERWPLVAADMRDLSLEFSRHILADAPSKAVRAEFAQIAATIFNACGAGQAIESASASPAELRRRRMAAAQQKKVAREAARQSAMESAMARRDAVDRENARKQADREKRRTEASLRNEALVEKRKLIESNQRAAAEREAARPVAANKMR